jgi:hypothetical protein
MTAPTYTARLTTRDGAREVQILRTLTDGDLLRVKTISAEDGWTQRDIDDVLRHAHWRTVGEWQDGDDGPSVAVEWTQLSWPVEVIDEDARRELIDAIREADSVWAYSPDGVEEYLAYQLDRYGWVSYIGSPMTTDYYLHESEEEAIAYLKRSIGESLSSRLDHPVQMFDGRGVAAGEIDGTWYVVRYSDGLRDGNRYAEWRECDDEEDADLQMAAWMERLAETYDRSDRLQRIAAAAYRRAAAHLREYWATQELGDAVRDAHEAGNLGRDGGLTVSHLASGLRVGREFLYRVIKGEEWNHRGDDED